MCHNPYVRWWFDWPGGQVGQGEQHDGWVWLVTWRQCKTRAGGRICLYPFTLFAQQLLWKTCLLSCCNLPPSLTPLSPYFICSVSLSLEFPPFSTPTLSLSLPLFFLPSSRSLSLSPMLLSIWWDWSPMRYRSRVSQGKVPNSSCAITTSTTITILIYPCKLPTHHLPPPRNAIVGLHSIPSRP